MGDFGEAVRLALALVFSGDSVLYAIIALSLWVSLGAVVIAIVLGLPAGAGLAISEVGAIVIVGGNIAGVTRTMTTTIMLETSKGNLPLALALGLVLVVLSLALNGLAFALADRKENS